MSQPTDEAAREAALTLLDAAGARWRGGPSTGYEILGRALLERDATIAELRPKAQYFDEAQARVAAALTRETKAQNQLITERAAREKAERERDTMRPLVLMAIQDAERCGCEGTGTDICREAYRVRKTLAPRETPAATGDSARSAPSPDEGTST